MNKLIKRIIIFVILIFFIHTVFSQQQSLNSYAESKRYYNDQIEKEEEYKHELTETQASVDSLEYIESVAREKLDMYLPNEKVYIDITQ